MYWPDNGSGVAAPPAPAAVLSVTPMYFTAGDPALMTPATEFDVDIANAIVVELLTPVTTAGLTPDKTANNQLTEAIRILAANYAKTTGGPLGFALTLANLPPLADGLTFGVEFNDVPNSADPTLQVNGGAIFNLYAADGVTQIAAGGLPKHALVRYSAEANANAGGFILLGATGVGGGGGSGPWIYRYNASFSVDAIAGMPATGTLEFLQVGPALAVMTMDATKFTAGQVIVSIMPMNETANGVVTSDTTIVSTNNVAIGNIEGAPQVLLNATLAQGIWQGQSGGTTAWYGLVQSAEPPIPAGDVAGGYLGRTWLEISGEIVVVWAQATLGVRTLSVGLFDPATKTLGPLTQFVDSTPGGAVTYLNPTIYSTGGAGFVIGAWGRVVAGEISGGALSFGAVLNIASLAYRFSNSSFAFVQLSASEYLAIHPISTVIADAPYGGVNCSLITITGTAAALTTQDDYTRNLNPGGTAGLYLGASYVVSAPALSATEALVSYFTLGANPVTNTGESGLVLIVVTGTALTFTEQTNAPAATMLWLYQSGGEILGYGLPLLGGAYAGGGFYAISVVGTLATAATFSAVQAFDYTVGVAYPGAQPLPYGQVGVLPVGAGSFIAAGGGQLVALEVAGAALTMGALVAVAADRFTSGVVALGDGSLVYQTLTGSQYTAHLFTVAGDVITVTGSLAMPVGVEPAAGPASSATLFGGCYVIGATVYPYEPNPSAGPWGVPPFWSPVLADPSLGSQLGELGTIGVDYTPINSAGDHLYAGGGVFSQYA